MTIHACCISIGGRGVLLRGPSGAGKSDLALRLIDRGAVLVSDDYTELAAVDGRLLASPPATIRGLIEIRGVGLAELPFAENVPVCLVADLVDAPQRLPEPSEATICGIAIPAFAIAALKASAPIKLEYALQQFGHQLGSPL